MITEDFVSSEVAKLLKEKGLNEDSWFHYDTDGDIVTRGYRLNHPDDIPAWTLQMAMKWLREVHKIFLNINFIQEHFCFTYRIIHNGVEEKFVVYSPTYEEAAEAAIRYCLTELI